MRTLLFGATLVTAFLFPMTPAAAQCCAPGAASTGDHAAHAAAPASPACCGDHQMTAATPAGCCGQQKVATAKPGACCADHQMAMAMPPDDQAVALAGLGLTPPPAVKYLDVTFRDPVRVGDVVLLGTYLIEHDDERMARGEPCTYIYEARNRTAPVVTFHCTHLDRPEAPKGVVVLAPTENPAIKQFKEFQFGGEAAAHGLPAVR